MTRPGNRGRRLVLNGAVLACLWPWLLERQRVLASARPTAWARVCPPLSCGNASIWKSRCSCRASVQMPRLPPITVLSRPRCRRQHRRSPRVSLLPPMEASNVLPGQKGLEGLLGRTDLPVQDPRNWASTWPRARPSSGNTVLKHWLDTLGLSATLELGGLRSTEYLRSMETIQPVDADAEDRVAG